MGVGIRRLLVLATLVPLVWFTGLGVAAAASNWVVPLASSSRAQAQAQPIPGPPTALTPSCVSSTGTTVKLTWNAVTLATTYTIYRSSTSSTSGFSATASGVTGTAWTSSTLSAATYWWRISVTTGTNWTSAQSASTTSTTIRTSGTKCTVP